jgi:hypothetical protein
MMSVASDGARNFMMWGQYMHYKKEIKLMKKKIREGKYIGEFYI